MAKMTSNHYYGSVEQGREARKPKFKDSGKEVSKLIEKEKVKYLKDRLCIDITGDSALSEDEAEAIKKAMFDLKFTTSLVEHALNSAVNDEVDDMQSVNDNLKMVKVSNGFWHLNAIENLESIKSKFDSANFLDAFYETFREMCIKSFGLRVDEKLSGEKYFYNMVKLYSIFTLIPCEMHTKNEETVNIFKLNNVELSRLNDYNFIKRNICKYLNAIVNDYPIGEGEHIKTIDKLIGDFLYDAFCRNFIANEFNIFKENYDRKKEKILNGETPLESAKVFSYDDWFTYNDCYYIFNEVLKKVCKVIFLSCILNDVNKVLELNELEQAKKQIQELSNNVETEKEKTNDKEKIIEAYKRAFEKCNLNEPNNNEVDTDDDSEKKIAKLDSVIVELERTNSKLKEKLEKSIEENKELQDTIKNILPEESQADLPKLEVETKQIDYNKKYAFLMENRQQLELEENLKNVFPNCIIAKKANQINKSVDLVVFITEFLSHATYGSVKKFCKDAGIDFIHCQSTNTSRIEQYIWDYYNTK